MKQYFILSMLSMALVGCGKSETSAPVVVQPDPIAAGSPPAASTYSYAQGIQGSGAYFYSNYQFKEGSCDTDLHRFSGPAPEIVRAQLCSGLRNEWMNHGCAKALREAYFSQICT